MVMKTVFLARENMVLGKLLDSAGPRAIPSSGLKSSLEYEAVVVNHVLPPMGPALDVTVSVVAR